MEFVIIDEKPRPRRVCLYNTMRLTSQRVPRKMLAAIDPLGKRLVDYALENMIACREFGVTAIAGVCWTDAELLEACGRAGVEVLLLDERAREGETLEDGFHDIPERLGPRFDWLVNVNLCHPFVRLETLAQLCAAAWSSLVPLVACVQERGLLFDGDGEWMLGREQSANTKTNPVYHRLSHLGYVVPTADWNSTPRINARLRPLALRLEPQELIDIDTPADLELARTYAAGRVFRDEHRGIDCSGTMAIGGAQAAAG